jgi:signal transduction histidine kinase
MIAEDGQHPPSFDAQRRPTASLWASLRSVFGAERPILRVQLAILYSGFFLGLLVVVLGAAGVLILKGSQSGTGAGIPRAANPPSYSVLLVLGLGLVAALVAVAGAWWLAGRFLRPLRAMTDAAQEISATNLHRRLLLTGPDDELTQLGRTLDGLFARLEASFESQRRFVANASHELRTPLAGQRTLLQVAVSDPEASVQSLREACDEALRLGDQQERLIEALLTLATSERGVERWDTFDLAEIAKTALTNRRELAHARQITVDTSLAHAPVIGDPTLVELLVANLVENALRHNVAGGKIHVLTAAEPDGGILTVSNTGSLVPDSAIPRLFQPFQATGADRTRQRADGHGLGLAIVRAAADAHGATIVVESRPGGGLEVTVRFPASESLATYDCADPSDQR